MQVVAAGCCQLDKHGLTYQHEHRSSNILSCVLRDTVCKHAVAILSSCVSGNCRLDSAFVTVDD